MPTSPSASRAFPLPTLAEGALHYTFHLPPPGSSDHPDSAALTLLISEYVESLLIQPWLWNKDGWELKVGSSKLEGRMRVGDAVDDEWLVVWLLREVSKRWPELVISIRDNDGEFLLIEAANELPSWVSPENADNRLWLQNAHLHLIPLTIRSSSSSMPRHMPDDEGDQRQYHPDIWINEADAVQSVRTGRYQADSKVERAVWERIACYPDALKTHQHRVNAYLPERVARALSVSPELVQRAVEGFYVRDPSQLRAASRMTQFPPAPSVLAPILLTRPAYAQLQGQLFHPPRIFGPEWSVQEGDELNVERRWRDLGVKIATGFEIMYREGGKGRNGETDPSASTYNSDPGYRTYIVNLKAAGFFGDELEGSEKWKVKETIAAKGWKDMRSLDTTSQRPSFAFQVDTAVDLASSLPLSALQASLDLPEDNDSWLEVSPDELDGMMMRASGRNLAPTGDSTLKEPAEPGEEHGQALQDLAKKVEQFVGGQGDVEGARFEDELSNDDLDDGMPSEDEDVDGNPKAPSGLSRAEQDERLRNLVPALPDSEWGQKSVIQAVPSIATEAVTVTPRNESKEVSSNDVTPTMRPPIFAKQSFDGVVSDSDEDGEEDDEILPPPGTLGRKIAEMRWSEGAPRIEEIDDEDEPARKSKLGLGDDIDEQMRRRVWGMEGERVKDVGMEIDPDMGEEEEEFLKFSREALGISDDMWEGILTSRRQRGAFVPKPVAVRPITDASDSLTTPQPAKLPSESPTAIASTANRASDSASQSGEVNMDLDSFDKVMAAMDTELAKATNKKPSAPQKPLTNGNPSKKPLPKLPTEADLDDMNDDDLAAMDRELRAALKGAGVEDDDDDDMGELYAEEAKGLEGEERREYKMMKDFLESYRSQAGTSGVVGNLFGRLGKGD